MNFILEYAQRKLLELGISNWETNIRLIEVLPNSNVLISAKNDISFFANAFSNGSSAISARIIADNMAMKLSPAVNQTEFFKHQFFFTGEIKITNKNSTDTLFVELLVMTPIKY